jgi:long-chain fatty acid transport protein
MYEKTGAGWIKIKNLQIPWNFRVPNCRTGPQARVLPRQWFKIEASANGRIIIVTLLLVCLMGSPAPAFAGGFFLSELGTPDVGLASAGYAARAQDASTLFTNPAGMTRLHASQLLVGVQPIYAHAVFSPNSQTTKSGTDGGNAFVPLPGASIFYVHSLTPDLKLGIGNCTYVGGALEYNLNWVGRYYLQGSTLLGSSILPTVAYRINKWLSVGAGFNVMVGYLKQKAAIKNLSIATDGQQRFQNWTAGIGGDIGVLVEPTPDTRFGIQYLTPVSLNFSDVPHFSGLGRAESALFAHRGIFGASLDLSLTVPQSLLFSAFHQINERVAVMGNAGWQNWSKFGEPTIGIDTANPKSGTINLRYQDTFTLAIGTQYRPAKEWLLSTGFDFDNSFVSSASRTVFTPLGNQYRFGMGAQYSFSEVLIGGFQYEFQWQGNQGLYQTSPGPVRGTVAGHFSSVNINFFSMNLIWKLGSTGP